MIEDDELVFLVDESDVLEGELLFMEIPERLSESDLRTRFKFIFKWHAKNEESSNVSPKLSIYGENGKILSAAERAEFDRALDAQAAAFRNLASTLDQVDDVMMNQIQEKFENEPFAQANFFHDLQEFGRMAKNAKEFFEKYLARYPKTESHS